MKPDPKHIRQLLKHDLPLTPGEAFFPRVETQEQIEAGKLKGSKDKGPEKGQKAASKSGQSEGPLGETKVASKTQVPEGMISIDQFRGTDLRVAKILTAERVPKSEKLVQLKVSLGDSERTIVAGIGQHYTPEELVDRLIVIVANLAPAKLMGLQSQGMVLAASKGDSLVLVTVSADIPLGAKVS
jgi:methionyl-tRNA synthetase